MSKKGPLSKAEKFYIQERYKEEGVEALAKDLDRPKNTIKRHITKCKDNEREAVEKRFSAGTLYAQTNGATIATQSASEYSDSVRTNTKKMTSRQAKCTTTTNKIDE